MKVKGPEGCCWVYHYPEANEPAALEISVSGSPALIAGIQELVQRGANLWPDAPAEVKAFADLVINSKVMQAYPGIEVTGVPNDPVQS